jgi:single-strand DNA-binding protein
MTLPAVTLTGNLVEDPALRFTASGLAVVSFRVACGSRKFDKATNEWSDGDTTFLDVSAWRQTAENVAESVVKGTTVTVTGRLKQRSYDANDGTKRTVYEVDADSIAIDLARCTADVRKVAREQSQGTGRAPVADMWNSAGGATNDEAPF